MHSFVDSTGQTRRLSLTVYTVDRIRDFCGIDLLSILDQQFDSESPDSVLYRLQHDRRLLAQTLHVILDDSAPEGVTFEDFCRAMDGDGLDRAADALILEIIELFPQHKREGLRRLVEMQAELNREIQKVVTMTADQIEDHLTDCLNDCHLLDLCSGNVPENSDSTPDTSPSGN